MENRKYIFCLICNEQTKFTAESFGRWHLKKEHKTNMKFYYDKYIKKDTEGKCQECKKKETKFISFYQGYLNYCSTKCAGNNIETQNRTKNTKKIKYGNENYSNSEKRKKTILKKYGVENISQNEEIKKQKKITLQQNYGVSNPNLSKKIRDKIIQTCLKKYGVKNPTMNKIIQEKRTQTIISKYGVDHYSKSINYRELQEMIGNWVPLEHKSDFEIYRMLVWKETEKWKKELFNNWNGMCYYTNEPLLIDKTKFNEPLYATVEHKISIFEGFKKNIPYNEIGNIKNLCICSRITNTIKGIKNEKQFKNFLKSKK